MPDRTIRERARKSEKLAAIGAEAERLWWRLVTMADDFGRIKDNAVLILSEAFPLMADRISVEQVDGWLSDLASADLVKRYSADGQAVVWLIGWTHHQEIERPVPSELPGPERIKPGRIVSSPRVTHARTIPRARTVSPSLTTGITVSNTGSNSGTSNLLLPGIDTKTQDTRPEGGYGGKPANCVDVDTIDPPEALRPIDTALRLGLGNRYVPTPKFYARIREYADITGLDLEYQAEGMVIWLTTNPKGKKYTHIPRFAETWLAKAAEEQVRRNRTMSGRNGYNPSSNGAGRPYGMGGPVSNETLESARRAEQRSRELGD